MLPIHLYTAPVQNETSNDGEPDRDGSRIIVHSIISDLLKGEKTRAQLNGGEEERLNRRRVSLVFRALKVYQMNDWLDLEHFYILLWLYLKDVGIGQSNNLHPSVFPFY